MALFTKKEAKNNGWMAHQWAIAFLAGIVSVIFLMNHISNGPRHFTIMQVLPDAFWYVITGIVCLICLALFIRHGFLTRKALASYDKVEKFLVIFIWIIFALTAYEKIILTIASEIYEAASSSSIPDGTIATMFYLVANCRRIWGQGIITTLEISLLGTFFGFLLAILLVFMRTQTPDKRDGEKMQVLKLIGNTFSRLYITIIRGTPMMVQVLIIYYAGFGFFKSHFTDMSVKEINSIYSFFLAGLITVTLNTTAYIAETLRGGIESIDKGQTEAARSLGMTSWQTMMKVVFPQAVKNSIPAIGNEFIINIKDTSVLNVIGVFELMYATTTAANTYYVQLPAYLVSALIYLFLTLVLSKLLDLVSKKLDMTSKPLPSSN